MELIVSVHGLLIVKLPDPLPETITVHFEPRGHGEIHDLFPRLGPASQPSLFPGLNLRIAAGAAERLAEKPTELAATLAGLEDLGYSADETSPDGVVHLRHDPSAGSNEGEDTSDDEGEEGEDESADENEGAVTNRELGDEAAYEQATWEAIAECRHLTPPYEPTAWIAMVHRWGAAEAARRLLISGDIQDGFRRLIAAGRHDLTVEWSALQPRWNAIFGAPHQEAARWRLRQAGINPDDA
jgi:hypothetical protein